MAERPAPWIFVVVALAIALAAYVSGQIVDGAGAVVVMGTSLGWVCLAQKLWGNKFRV